ncbi:MAG: alkyl sulfatase dimerization domain-containing protein [Pseudomonadota bacterium]
MISCNAIPKIFAVIIVPALLLAGCDRSAPLPPAEGSDATSYTIAVNNEFANSLNLDDQEGFEDASRGLIAEAPAVPIKDNDGKVIWDAADYDFVQGDSPDTVNPSLWRQSKLNLKRGLFEVDEGIYQLRGFDLANITIIEGDTGWIVIDPLTTEATTREAMAFAREHLGDNPISAILFTHSHIDHFGGVFGLMTAEEARENNVEIVAPVGFIEEATSENILAGPAMTRRALYMYGERLPRSETGHVNTGLGIQPVIGTVSIMVPTKVIEDEFTNIEIDGVPFQFMNAAHSEAPAEFVFYLPEHNALCGSEVVSHTMHNLYTLRGAKVRDALKWAGYIDEMLQRWGTSESFFASHHWPIWGSERISIFLEKQRDLYRFIHDQTVRWANDGLTPKEIADKLVLPDSLAQVFYNRGYYGTLRHNSKAVYQYYFGWYDGNPANLNPLAPEPAGKRYVEYMGGAEAVIEKAQASFDQGEYRWVAEVLNHVVFADPNNTAAKALLAETYRQLGYQAESGPWRDVYLTGAYELQVGAPKEGFDLSEAGPLLEQTPVIEFLRAISVRLKAEEADGLEMTVNIIFTDLGDSYVLELKNSVLHYREGAPAENANATLNLTHPMFMRLLLGEAGVRDIAFSDDMKIEGSRLDLVKFFGLLDQPTGNFNIVTP